MTTVSAHEARQKFAELIELAFYKNAQIRIERNKKPMARIVGEPFMKVLDSVIDHIIEHEPAIADTLAIMIDDEIRTVIEQGIQEIKAGKLIPIESILNE
jgi:antitoxin (DNA-binding transcriptional repressor) of toxin-antitoxin stability system